jgi:transformer-2 protein
MHRPAGYDRSRSRSRSPYRKSYRSRSRSPRRSYRSRSRERRSPARYGGSNYYSGHRSDHRRGGYEPRGYDRGGYDRFRGGYERRPMPPRERRPVYRGTEEERTTSTTLYIGNLPYSYEERDLAHLMERFGRLRKITIPIDRFTHRNRGFGFVEFEERRDAEDAMEKYQGYPVEGRQLRLDWDVGAERKAGNLNPIPNESMELRD